MTRSYNRCSSKEKNTFITLFDGRLIRVARMMSLLVVVLSHSTRAATVEQKIVAFPNATSTLGTGLRADSYAGRDPLGNPATYSPHKLKDNSTPYGVLEAMHALHIYINRAIYNLILLFQLHQKYGNI
jgi:hypothetical protein